ncbi:MAG: PQQ-binding-like beta-propeller repeat protein [Pirellulaceae bacterium]|nr:PQQ-binding-like beta-propeller repeat protein [Pirellulaceae bacterium]
MRAGHWALWCGMLTTWMGTAAVGASENWPTFRGPDGNGVAPASANPPLKFGPEQNLQWKVPVPGRGHSSPIVWNGRIYLMTAIENQPQDASPSANQSDEQSAGRRRGLAGMNNPKPTAEFSFNVLCMDLSDGKTVWNQTVCRATPHEGGHRSNTYASASVVTDGRYLWCNFGSQGVWCLDLDGNVIWNKDLGQMTTRNQFGEGASVAVHGDVLVIPWDQEQNSYILAVNARTGEDLWRQDRNELTSWSTPRIIERFGRVQVIANGTTIRSYDLKSGELLWQCGGQTTNPIPTPLIWKDTTICMTGHRGFSIQAIALNAAGDVTDSDRVTWKRSDSAPYIASPTLVDDTVYLVKGNSGILSAVNVANGETVIDQQRLPGVDQMYASLVTAGGHVYAVGRGGMIVVLKHGPRYDEVHRVELGEPVDATPAISGQRLLIRSHEHLYCFAEGK